MDPKETWCGDADWIRLQKIDRLGILYIRCWTDGLHTRWDIY
jgi:hypothetical protein